MTEISERAPVYPEIMKIIDKTNPYNAPLKSPSFLLLLKKPTNNPTIAHGIRLNADPTKRIRALINPNTSPKSAANTTLI